MRLARINMGKKKEEDMEVPDPQARVYGVSKAWELCRCKCVGNLTAGSLY